MNKKTLILIPSYERYFWQYIDLITEEHEVFAPYVSYSRILPHEYIRKHRKYNFIKVGKKTKWINHLSVYDKVIIFDGAYSNEIGRILRKRFFKNGTYLILWNYTDRTPSKQWDMLNVIEKNIKIYSFNKTDCQKYNLLFNPTFYEPCTTMDPSMKIKYDIMFSGLIKHDRVNLLETTLKYIHIEQYNYLIDVWDTNVGETQYFEIKNESTSYMDYLKMIAQSRAMLDLRDIIEEGLSLRALEAMFYHKKLITNSPYIKKEAFYSSINIFILGEDDLSTLHAFVYSPFNTKIDTTLDDYRMKAWIERFI